MSGPWDRPSPDPGADWPSEDLDSPQSAEPREPEGDARASGDLWSESPRDAGSDWGDWPAPAPPADDYIVDEPQPTLSDPWAESWTDESADELASADGPWADRPGDDTARPAEPPPSASEAEIAQPPVSEPAPVQPAWSAVPAPDTVVPEEVAPDEVAREATAPEVVIPEEVAPEPIAPEATVTEPEAPSVQPWAVDTDPWGPAAPAEAPDGEAAVEQPAPPALPDWLAEPEPEPVAEASQPAPAWTPVPPAAEPGLESEPEPEPEPQVEVAAGDDGAEAEPAPEVEPGTDAAASWRRFVPWAATAAAPPVTSEAETVAEADTAAETAAEPEPDIAPAVDADDSVADEASSPWQRLTPWAADLAAASTVTPEAVTPEAGVAEPEPEAASEPEPDAAPAPEVESEATSVADADTERELAAAAQGPAQTPAETESLPDDEASPWRRIAPWLAASAAAPEVSPEPEASAAADMEAEAGAEADQEAAAEPEARPEPGADAAVAAAAQAEPDAEVVAEAVPAVEAEGVDEAESTSAWRRLAPWAAGAAAAAAAAPAVTPEPEAADSDEPPAAEADTDPIAALRAASPWAEPEVVESPAEPEPAWSAADAWGALAEPEPDVVEAAPQQEAEPTAEGVPESTQVFPTSWTPPPAPPPGEGSRTLEPVAGDVRTRLATPEPDLDGDLEPEASTAEQAVPWLIGFILLLAGMVIVLLALIFAGDQSLSAGLLDPSASAAALASASVTPIPSVSQAPSATVAPSATPAASPTPAAVPEYGALEMIYQGRAAALAPIYLLRHDFTTEDEPVTLAQDPSLDVRRFAWTPDGTIGAGLLADVLVSIEEGQEKRRLGDGIMTITFGEDASTVYAVRVTEDGANDVATVLAVDFASGDTTELASLNYPRPDIAAEEGLAEAQFADDGGAVRLFWMEDGMLRLWALGAGTWEIAPDDGAVTDLEEALPILWSPGGDRRVTVEEDGGTSTIALVDEDGDAIATTTADGLVSHLRWSPGGDRVAFTLGRSASGGGVLQNLYLWDLGDGESPMQLTSTGAAFGVEWRGTSALWRD